MVGTKSLIIYAALTAGMALSAPLPARELDVSCGMHSDYDFTITDSVLVFERGDKVTRRLEMGGGGLSLNGKALTPGAGDRNRIAAFEAGARALVPKVKALAQRAVDLSVAAVREEAAKVSPQSATDPRLNARLESRARDIKSRIAGSNSSKDWRGAAFQRYAAEVLGDVIPLLAGDLGQEAVVVALRGDLAAAATLRDRALDLRPALEARVRAKLDTLQPQIEQLCSALIKLDALESAVIAKLPDGSRLNLIEIGG